MKGSRELSRREFLKASVILSGGLIMPKSFFSLPVTMQLHKPIGESATICCFCGVGCGAIVASQDGRIINLEGDPDHPINQGSLCAKGASLYQLAQNPKRITTVLYRAPNSAKWETKTWDWALKEIAKRVGATAITGTGRPGWARMLKSQEHRVFEIDLTEDHHEQRQKQTTNDSAHH